METEQWASDLAGRITAGCVIGLSGDLGAGKTQFVKGLARGLGLADRVHSPTFALVNVYSQGPVPLFHLDLYRLENHGQIIAAGLEEYFEPRGIAVVEWVERWQGPKPSRYHQIQMVTLTESERRLEHEYLGS